MTVNSSKFKSFLQLLLLLICEVVCLLLLRLFMGEALSQPKIAAHKSENPNTSAPHKSENPQTSPYLIIFWSTYFGRKVDIQLAWKKGECPVACEVTSNHSRVDEANGFVVHARDPNMTPPNVSMPWILLSQENPVYTPALRDANFMSKFNLLQSYRLDSDFPYPTFLIPELTPPVPFKEKSGLVFAAFSNCEPVRIEYMRQLMKFIPIDSYGGCLNNKRSPNLGRIYAEKFKEQKTVMAKTYKFTLVFFNQDCDYFVDEQLTHALSAGSVPVVMATDKLDEFLPGNLQSSVIKVRDFKSPRLLANYLKNLSNDEPEYSKYLKWKSEGFGDIRGTAIGKFWMPEYPIYCQICVALSEGRIHKDGLKVVYCKARAFEDWGIIPGA